jgi:hypothetical protein
MCPECKDGVCYMDWPDEEYQKLRAAFAEEAS